MLEENEVSETETTQEVSIEEALKSSYKEITEREETAEPAPAKPETEEEKSASSTPKPEAEKPAVEEKVDNSPQSFSAAAKAKWAEVPEEVKAEISKREADVHKMMTAADGELRMGREMKEVLTPYMAIINSEGGTPATAVRDLLNTAYVLRTGSASQKTAILRQIAQQYGIEWDGGANDTEYVDPNIKNLQNEIATMKQQYNPENMHKQLQERMENDRIVSEVNSFASDPTNRHYEQVKNLMASLLGSGSAGSMKEAYEIACKAHPQVSSIVAADNINEQKLKQNAEIAAKKKAASSISSTTGSPGNNLPNTRKPSLSLEDELKATYRSLTS